MKNNNLKLLVAAVSFALSTGALAQQPHESSSNSNSLLQTDKKAAAPKNQDAVSEDGVSEKGDSKDDKEEKKEKNHDGKAGR